MFCGCKVTKKSRLTYCFFGNNASALFFARFYPQRQPSSRFPVYLQNQRNPPRFSLKGKERVGDNLLKPPIGIQQRFARTADSVSQMSWSSGRLPIIQANHSRHVSRRGQRCRFRLRKSGRGKWKSENVIM